MSVVVSRKSSYSSRSSVGSSGLSLSGGMPFQAVGGGKSRMSVSASSVGSSRTPSVYGGAGGYGTRISQSVSAFSMAAPSSEYIMNGNEKVTMQNLNDRLATYLEKVRSLEAANRKLELQIKEFYEKRSPVHSNDLTVYLDTISGLREKIQLAYTDHAQVTLQVDNARLAADDFKIKFEMELNMRMMVEADIVRLRGVLDSFTLSRSDLEMQMEGLREELVYLKKSHEEEMGLMRVQQGGAVNVEMDCPASADLNKELRDMREQYESLVQKNQREAEKWFQGKVEALKVQITTSTTEVKTSQSELGDRKRTFQSLEVELQGMLTKLSTLQLRINALEEELQQLTASIHHQATEYKVLLDIKMRLEMEIAEYRRLLDGEAYSNKTVVSTTSHQSNVREVIEKKVIVVEKVQEVTVVEEEHNPHLQRRVKTIVEEIVDGKVVATSSSEKVQELS
ncbi:keratin 99 isoform X2 [Hypomesus transpacificus]|uniref:keratin 99 isoform X2 n=1 Tax=Hypomesus transpacificus TaxID=137520 RepID=UPI001F072508|nr:keratin 99 isoform X2 [Hypomesus transpacificus]